MQLESVVGKPVLKELTILAKRTIARARDVTHDAVIFAESGRCARSHVGEALCAVAGDDEARKGAAPRPSEPPAASMQMELCGPVSRSCDVAPSWTQSVAVAVALHGCSVRG